MKLGHCKMFAVLFLKFLIWGLNIKNCVFGHFLGHWLFRFNTFCMMLEGNVGHIYITQSEYGVISMNNLKLGLSRESDRN